MKEETKRAPAVFSKRWEKDGVGGSISRFLTPHPPPWYLFFIAVLAKLLVPGILGVLECGPGLPVNYYLDLTIF